MHIDQKPTLHADDYFDADFSFDFDSKYQWQILMAMPEEEFRRVFLADLLNNPDYSDAELEEQFHIYKQTIVELSERGLNGEGQPGDVELAQRLIIAARCVLTEAYRRGLQWALAEAHKTRPIATA
jgi:hypothetical protein